MWHVKLPKLIDYNARSQRFQHQIQFLACQHLFNIFAILLGNSLCSIYTINTCHYPMSRQCNICDLIVGSCFWKPAHYVISWTSHTCALWATRIVEIIVDYTAYVCQAVNSQTLSLNREYDTYKYKQPQSFKERKISILIETCLCIKRIAK